jgi:Flp pilus assembly protein TadG
MLLRSRSNRRRAAHLVELAFVAPAFFLFLFGVFEYGRYLFAMNTLNNAAREGARYAAVNTTAVTTAQIQTYTDGYLAGMGPTLLSGYTASGSISVYKADPNTGANLGAAWQNAAWGDGIGVSITGTYQPLFPGLTFLGDTLTISGSCVMSSEAN